MTNLLTLNGKEKIRYLNFLSEALEYNPFKFAEVEDIQVDKRGYSPEIADLNGTDYLQNKLILIKAKQQDCDLISPGFSYQGPLINDAITQYEELISEISLNELVYVNMDHKHVFTFENNSKEEIESEEPIVVDLTDLVMGTKTKRIPYADSSSKGDIELTPTTTKNTVHQINTIIKGIELIGTDSSYALNDALVSEIKELSKIQFPVYGNLSRFKDKFLNSYFSDIPKIIKYQDSKKEWYFLESNDKSSLSVMTFTDKFTFEVPAKLKGKLNFFSQKNLAQIVNLLVENDYMIFDKEAGKDRMEEIEDNILIKYGHKLVRIGTTDENKELITEGEKIVSKEVSRMERYRLFRTHKELNSSLGDDWSLLKNAIYKGMSIDNLPLELQLPFIGDSTKDPLVKEIISRINPTNFVYTQNNNPEGFKEFFGTADIDSKKMILTRFERTPEDTINPDVISWLQEHYNEILPKKFKKKTIVSYNATTDKWGEA